MNTSTDDREDRAALIARIETLTHRLWDAETDRLKRRHSDRVATRLYPLWFVLGLSVGITLAAWVVQ